MGWDAYGFEQDVLKLYTTHFLRPRGTLIEVFMTVYYLQYEVVTTHLSNLSIFFPLCGPLGENEPTSHTKGAYKKTLSIRVIICKNDRCKCNIHVGEGEKSGREKDGLILPGISTQV